MRRVAAAAAPAVRGARGRPRTKGRPRSKPRKAVQDADIARNLQSRLRLLPFCTQETKHEGTASDYRVWIDNLPYDSTLEDLTRALGNVCPITGVTLFRPPLSAALLIRRRRAEHDALENQKLQRMVEVARLASASAHTAVAMLDPDAPLVQPPRKRRGRPREPEGSTFEGIEGSGIDSNDIVRQSNRSLAIMRHGDFNSIRCFGYLHVESPEHMRAALSRSLRIFGVSFQGRTCPTVDARAKYTAYIEGAPVGTRQQDVLAIITEAAGPVVAQHVTKIHPYSLDDVDPESTAAQHRAIAESSTAFDEELQYLIEFADHRSAALFLQRTAGQQMMAATILNDGTPIRARWADAIEERHISSLSKTEAEVLNDEE